MTGGQLILSKIIKIVSTSYLIIRLKCTKFDFSRPRPRWGAHSDPPDFSAGFKGPTSKGMGGEGDKDGTGSKKGRAERAGQGEEGEGEN